jgi:dTDP-glucose 4,6-dehydratase
MMNLLITGGCGFIGSNFVELVLTEMRDAVNKVVNLDALTYAGTTENTQEFTEDEKYIFEKVDICNLAEVHRVCNQHDITHIVHLAAESHVDNSILNPRAFIDTNVLGTYNLLQVAKQNGLRFHHVSTDEVYGELGETGKFNENTAYDPRNPYSASKASSDFLVMAYYHTYGLEVTISNCSNNYGPRQHQEKFIPTVISCILNGKKIPLYGTGTNIRDWIYVKDHCIGIWDVLTSGVIGETYCIGSNCEKRNIDIIHTICSTMGVTPEESIEYVEDRLGHDFRYAIDSAKITENLSWRPRTSFEDGIEMTIRWYNEKN